MADAETKPQERKRSVWRWLGLVLALAAAGLIANVFRSYHLGLSRNVREAVAVELEKKVWALTTGDLARVTGLGLHDDKSPLLHLPASLSRWQHLIPVRKRIITDDDLNGLDKLPALRGLNLVGTHVTDAMLIQLAKLPALQGLYLDRTQVTDAGLEHLAKLPTLQRLNLAETHVTDAGLEHLAKLPTLQRLNLYRTQVTDAGLVHLENLPALEWLNLYYTQVTDAGEERFKEERRKAGLPECEVVR